MAVPLSFQPYSLNEICDKYNDLIDLKAYAEVLKRSDFPSRLLPCRAEALGTLLVNISPTGVVEVEAPERRTEGGAPACAFMWVNIERLDDHPSPLHSNVLLWNGGFVHRFEPHGGDPADARHQDCGFRGYYAPAVLDSAIEHALSRAGLLPAPGAYIGVDTAFPVLGQSLSTNDSPLNTTPGIPGRAFKRVGAITGTGDNFCGAWTILYIVRALGAEASKLPQSAILAGLCGAEVSGVTDSARPAADIIAAFILHARAVYADDIKKMQDDPQWEF